MSEDFIKDLTAMGYRPYGDYTKKCWAKPIGFKMFLFNGNTNEIGLFGQGRTELLCWEADEFSIENSTESEVDFLTFIKTFEQCYKPDFNENAIGFHFLTTAEKLGF